MVDEVEDTTGTEEDTAGDTQDTTGNDTAAQDGDKDEGGKLSKEALQQIASMTGRLIKKQLDETVMPLLQKTTEEPVTNTGVADNQTALDKFNEQLQEKIFSGNVTGAMAMYNQVNEQTKTNLAKNQQTQTAKAIASYSDRPYYKEIYQNMTKIAQEAVGKGFPPDAAAEHAYEKAKAGHFEKQLGGGKDTDGLEMLTGGRRTSTTKTPKLPPAFKEAYARDKAKGLFKDEQDYINHLSPRVREAHGL